MHAYTYTLPTPYLGNTQRLVQVLPDQHWNYARYMQTGSSSSTSRKWTCNDYARGSEPINSSTGTRHISFLSTPRVPWGAAFYITLRSE